MKLPIVEAGEEHIDGIGRLEEICFCASWIRGMIARQMKDKNQVFLCAMDGDRVAGYAGFSYVLDEGYVGNVAVDPCWQRQGVGGDLVDAMIRKARQLGLAFLTLEVRRGNAPARALYESRGFREVGVRKNYYEKPVEDAILMTVWLREKSGDESAF